MSGRSKKSLPWRSKKETRPMMASTRIKARISSVAVLSLALLVGSASAEWGWVLWEQDTRLLPDSMSDTWTILRTYDARAECQTEAAKLLLPGSAWGAGYPL